MTYGTIKVDTVTFTDAGVDKSVTLSGLVQNPTFSGNVTVTGTLSGVTVTGTTANFTSGNFTNISGGTHTITSGVFAAGSAASPSITFTGDLNTGIYSPGADQVAISTGGSGRLFVDASGRVGVGTSPSYALHVSGTGTVSSRTFATDAIGDASFFVQNDGNGICGPLVYGSTKTAYGALASNETAFYSNRSTTIMADGASTVIKFATGGNTERLRITSAGLVGIGTSSPSYALQVAETSAVVSAASYSTFFGQGTRADLVLQATSSNNDQQRQVIRSNSDSLIFGTENAAVTTFTEKLRIDSSGRVGIGTSSPVAPLHVSGSGVFARLTDTQAYSFGTSGPILDFTGNDSSGASILFARLQGSPSNGNPDRGFLNILTRVNGVNTSTLQVGTGLAADVFVPNGRLGVGTTSPGSIFDVKPSASSSTLRIEAGTINSDSVRLSAGGTVNTYLEYRGYLGHAWFVDATERARIDSSGRLLVGTTSARSQQGVTTRLQVENTNYDGLALAVNSNTSSETCPVIVMGRSRGTSLNSSTSVINNDRLAAIFFQGADGTDIESSAGAIECFVDGTPGANDMPGRLVFSTTADGASSPTERMRINSTGTHIAYGLNDTFYSTTNRGAGTLYATYIGTYGATSPAAIGTISFVVWSNGDVVNNNNSYGAYSDIKLKENVVDAASQWSDIKSLQVRKYNFKEGQTHTQIGLVAQEVELVSPGLVTETPDRDADGNDLGTVTKSVNYSVLYMKAVKALQEAMERIELLEARLDAANL